MPNHIIMDIPPFHIAIPSNDLQKSCQFYGKVLGCTEGRSEPKHWVDYNFYGHQLVCHYTHKDYTCQDYSNDVDKQEVPVPHFGLVLSVQQWKQLRDKLVAVGIAFIVEPQLRFQGLPGEQYTMFFKDPTGNNLEFKAMVHPQNLFAKNHIQN